MNKLLWNTGAHTQSLQTHSKGLCGRCCHPDSLLILQAIQLRVTAADTVWFTGAVLSLLWSAQQDTDTHNPNTEYIIHILIVFIIGKETIHPYGAPPRIIRAHGYFVVKNPSLPSPLGYLKIINGEFGTLFSRISEWIDSWPKLCIFVTLDRSEKSKSAGRGKQDQTLPVPLASTNPSSSAESSAGFELHLVEPSWKWRDTGRLKRVQRDEGPGEIKANTLVQGVFKVPIRAQCSC